MQIRSNAPSVKLVQAFESPMKTVVAAARTCYASNPVLPESVDMEKFGPLARSIYDAGHHTTYQHPTFQFLLQGVSRQFIWSSLHAHPFYNCVAGDTVIRLTGGKEKTIEEIYALYDDPAKRHYVEKMELKCVSDDREVVLGKIKTVVMSGIKDIFELKSKLGYTIKCTLQHRFMLSDYTFAPLEQFAPGDLVIMHRSGSKKCFSDMIESITPCGKAMTYDIEMDGPNHNFIANSFCVHNSEQVSQRYVPVKAGNYLIPDLPDDLLALYDQTTRMMFAAYEDITNLLTSTVKAHFHERFNAHPSREKAHNASIQKRAQEVARYVLPISTHANLYHTVSGLTLQRYWRSVNGSDCSAEAMSVYGQMIKAVSNLDPEWSKVLENPAPETIYPHNVAAKMFPEIAMDQPAQAQQFKAMFDHSLGDGISSKLISYSSNGAQVLADSVREAMGWTSASLSNEEAIDLVMNPKNNKILGEKMNMVTMDKVSRAMHNVTFTFRKKLSHTGDSQDQRHRMTPGSRPLLSQMMNASPDYHTPELLKEENVIDHDGHAAIALYHKTMEAVWKAAWRIAYYDIDAATYLMPNAVNIRFTQTGDLAALWHKYKMRLCYNAQEEIWKASVDEVQQIREVMPEVGKYLMPPCGVRAMAGVKPICPEGPRYCGIPVWRLGLDDYKRVI